MKRLESLGLFFASIVICTAALAQTAQKNNSPVSFVGPKILESGKIFACGKKAHSSRCLTASIPPELGEINGIVPLNRRSGSTVYWELVTQKTVAVCGMNFKVKQAVCSPVSDLRSALNDVAKFRNESTADTIKRYKPRLNAAIRVVSANLGDKAIKSGNPTTSFRPLEQVDDGGWGDGGGGGGGGDGGSGGGGDGGDVPVVVVIGNPDTGGSDGDGGDDGGDDSGNPTPVSTEPSPPPGASNNESPARAKCMASAYAVWLIEDAVCRSQKDYRDYLACNDYNWREYNISRDLCVQQFP